MTEREVVDGDAVGSLGGRTADGGSRLAPVKPVVAVAAREFRIALRQRWTVGLVALFAAFSLGVVLFGTSEVGPGRYGAVLASLVELGVYVLPLAALAFGFDVVVGAEENGRLELLFALPASRGAVVVGKYLGRAATLGGAMAVGLSAGGLLLAVLAGGGLGLYGLFVLAAIGTSCGFLAVSVVVSSVATEKTRALGGALVAWAWFVLLHDLAALGLVAAVDLPDGALAALVVTNPADVLRLLVLGELPATAGGFAAVLVEAGLSPVVLWAAALAWIGLPLVVAARVVRRRRL